MDLDCRLVVRGGAEDFGGNAWHRTASLQDRCKDTSESLDTYAIEQGAASANRGGTLNDQFCVGLRRYLFARLRYRRTMLARSLSRMVGVGLARCGKGQT